MSTFRINTSKILLTLLIGVIIISFMISDRYMGPGSSGGSIAARVGKQNITMMEFEQAYQSRMNLYRQFFQGRDFSPKELKKMRIKESVLSELISQRLMLTLSQNVGLSVGHAQLLDYIKQLPYFKKNEVFDAELYKEKLTSAQLSTKQFEDQILKDLENKLIEELFAEYPLSVAFLDDVAAIKKDERILDVVHWSENELYSFIEKNPEEINQYLAKKENDAKVNALFKDRLPSLTKPEMIDVSHILLTKNKDESNDLFNQRVKDLQAKLTVDNFAQLAQEFSTDPGSKGKGGSLGTTPRGQMVPSFDDAAFSMATGVVSAPVSSDYGTHFILVHRKIPEVVAQYEDYKVALAKELMQKSSRKEIQELHNTIKQKALNFLKNDFKALEELAQSYKLTLQKDQAVNMLTKSIGSMDVDQNELIHVFKANPGTTLEWNKATYSAVVIMKEKKINDKVQNDEQTWKREFISQIKNNALEGLKNKLSVKTFVEET